MVFLKTFSMGLIFLLTGCDPQASSEKKDELIVGTSADLRPFEYYIGDSAGMHLNGFDIELAKLVGAQLGKKIVFRDMDFSALMPALMAGQVDIVMAALSPTPLRLQDVNFSDNYLSMSAGLLLKKSANIRHIKDLSRRKVGVRLASSYEFIAEQIHEQDDSVTIITRERMQELIYELSVNSLDAVMLDAHAAREIVKEHGWLTYVVIDDLHVDCAIAVAKQSPLQQQINQALSTLHQKGIIDELKAKWLTKQLTE